MKAPVFLQGVIVALSLSIAGAAMFSVLRGLTDPAQALRAVVSLVTVAYALYLLQCSKARVGKVTATLALIVLSVCSWLAAPELLPFALLQLGTLWLLRCFCFHRRVSAALIDMGLQVLSVAAAVWAIQETGSIWLCLWSFFLVQSLFVFIPERGFLSQRNAVDGFTESSFNKAHRSAEAALRRLSQTPENNPEQPL